MVNQSLQMQIDALLSDYLSTSFGLAPETVKSLAHSMLDNGKLSLTITLGFPALTVKEKVLHDLKVKLEALKGISQALVELTWEIKPFAVQQGLRGIPNVKNIIAVASGKGGVGKSTTAVNLAIALKQEGVQVGILDADIYGPNQPQMLGISQPKLTPQNQRLNPVISHGLQAMSIGFLIEQDDTPMIWRGPMVSMALQQLLNDTDWDALDYLIIDLPPGTGDIQLTLSQKIPVSGAVIVTTQDIALVDARKAYRMFEKVRVPILGVIENMSVFVCSHCGHSEHIFGSKGAAKLAAQYGIDYLGEIPLTTKVREYADAGTPITAAEPENNISKSYRDIALRMTANLSLRQKNYMRNFPKIEIENK